MEKFEKHIKEKLEAREISPSENAWGKISEALSKVEEPGKKRSFGYFIAATIIGLLIALGIFIFENESEVRPTSVVEEDKSSREVLGEKEKLDFNLQDAKVTEISKDTFREPEIEVVSEEPEQVVKQSREVQYFNEIPLQDSAIAISEDIIEKKANEVLKQVLILENTNSAEITDAEVDSLLRAAQREIFKDKLLNPQGKVDAMALLTEVEDELDESFRDQIFDALKQGYLKVRTAVADRNN